MSLRINSNDNPNLPPGSNNNPIQNKLTIEMGTIQILDISPRPVYIKLQMWGDKQQNKIEKDRPLCFNVRTACTLLAEYLRDMKVTIVKLCDCRNNEELGTGLINWILFMKKTGIKQSPFMENNFQTNVSIMNYKKKQIAQVQFIINWQKVTIIEDDNTEQGSQIRGNSSNYLGNYDKLKKSNDYIKSNFGSQSKNIVEEANNRQSIIRHHNKIVSIMQNQQQEQNQYKNDMIKPIIKPNSRSSFKKANNVLQDPIFMQTQPEPTFKNIRYPQSTYQLQKTKLKLQAQQFLTLTKKQYQNSNYNKTDMMTIRISDLITLKPNTIVQFIDLHVVPKISAQQEDGSDRKHMRIFSNAKNANVFNAQIVMQDKQTLEIQIGKGLAKASIQGKYIKQKQLYKAPLYGKTGKFGAITLTKIYQLKQNKIVQDTYIPSQQSKQLSKSKASQNKPAVVSASPKNAHNLLQNKNQGFLLITIKQAKHNHAQNFDIMIKNYVFGKPYPSFNILPISELGSLFAIQFRNPKNETFDSAIISDFIKVSVPQQSLGCVALQNGWVEAENGYANLQIMMGSMKQVNYQLARQNSYKNKNQQYLGNFIDNIKQQPQRMKVKTISDKPIQQKSNPKLQTNKRNEPKYQKFDTNQNVSLEQSSQNYTKSKNDNDIKNKNLNKGRGYSKKSFNKKIEMKMKTQPISEYNIEQEQQSQQQQQNQDDDVFLVQVLSRFLHALPAQKFSETAPNNVIEFQNLLFHFLAGRQQKQLVGVVLDMFIDDTGVQQGQHAKLQYEQFLKCVKGYHNFVQLWWKMRVDTLSKIIKDEPDYANKINQYSELGMITKQKLWKKALNKVDNPQIKLKVEKMYNISSQMPISCQLLIQDLKRVQSSPTTVPTQANPYIIRDLGKLIKQTMQSILQGSGLQAPLIGQDRVNIRIMCDTLQRMHITLSYWQALMLIQQLKGWYNIDLELNQGIVSGSTVEVWLKSVLNRSTVSSRSSRSLAQRNRIQTQQSRKQFIQPQPPQQQQHKLQIIQSAPNNEKASNQYPLSSNPSQKILLSNRVMQNKSVARSQLNEQQIYNIASLLRDNDDFRLGTLSSEKPTYQINNNASLVKKSNNNNVINNRILEDGIIDMTNQDQSQSQSDIINKVTHSKQPQLTKQPPHPSSKPKYLHARIKSIKLKKQPLYPIKLVMRVYPNRQHYYLCKQMAQIQGRQMVQQLVYNWNTKSQGLRIQLVRIQQNRQQQIHNEYNNNKQILVHGVLLHDEIVDIGDGSKIKTIVLYGNRQILGKVSIQIKLSDTKPQIFDIDNNNIKLSIQITSDMAHSHEWTHFTIGTTNQIYQIQQKQKQKQSMVLQNVVANKQYQIVVKQTYYKHILVVHVDGVGRCSVPMQQLYFKSVLAGEYPVIAHDGSYLGNLYITLNNPNNILLSHINNHNNHNMMIQQISNNIINNNNSSRVCTKYLLIFDSLSTMIPVDSALNLSIVSNIFVRDGISRSVLYRSPYYIQHAHSRQHAHVCTYLSDYSTQNYCIIQQHTNTNTYNNRQITIQLEYNGRHIGIGQHVINVHNFKYNYNNGDDGDGVGCRYGYMLKYVGNASINNVIMSIGMRVLQIPTSYSKYNVFRIYTTLAKHKYNLSSTQQQYHNIDNIDNNKQIDDIIVNNRTLTIVQQRLLKQIISHKYGCIYSYYQLSVQAYMQLVKELSFVDSSKCGIVTYSQLLQILQPIIGTRQMGTLLLYYTHYYYGESTSSSRRQHVSSSAIVNSKLAYHKSNTDPLHQQSIVNYMNLLQFVYPAHGFNHTYSQQPDYLFKTNQNGSSIIDQVDKLHREIKLKYTK